VILTCAEIVLSISHNCVKNMPTIRVPLVKSLSVRTNERRGRGREVKKERKKRIYVVFISLLAGYARHRTLLFKYLADAVSLPARIRTYASTLRTPDSQADTLPHDAAAHISVVEVYVDAQQKWCVVDLVKEVGELYEEDSPKAKEYTGYGLTWEDGIYISFLVLLLSSPFLHLLFLTCHLITLFPPLICALELPSKETPDAKKDIRTSSDAAKPTRASSASPPPTRQSSVSPTSTISPSPPPTPTPTPTSTSEASKSAVATENTNEATGAAKENGNGEALEFYAIAKPTAAVAKGRLRSGTGGIPPRVQRHSSFSGLGALGLKVASKPSVPQATTSTPSRILRVPTESAEIILNERVGKGISPPLFLIKILFDFNLIHLTC
jgi:Ethylene-responsive protein kinase Le-CTR1